ncbi:Non-specific lipid-transfer protein 1 [Linum grandiflorum]
MANINIISFTILTAVVAICSMAGTSEATWPPLCAGFTKLVTKPCLDYVKGNAAEIPADCCAGLKAFTKDAKKTTAKRRAGCYCVKQSAMNSDYKRGRVQNVAATCGYKLPDPTMNCQTDSMMI